jgi:hypothetical protein
VTATLASRYELIVFDLDGVIYLGTEAVVGAPAAIRAVVESGTAVAYATNNASRSAAEVAQLLRSIDVPARAEEVLTAARRRPNCSPATCRPVAGAHRGREGAGGRDPRRRPHAGVPGGAGPVAGQGYGPEVGWAELAEATVAIRAGARWVATNTDVTMPSPRGPLPGNGSLVAALSTALGGRAPDTVVGKPEPTMVEVAARGPDGPRHTLVVGDRLDTDMERDAGRHGRPWCSPASLCRGPAAPPRMSGRATSAPDRRVTGPEEAADNGLDGG